MASPKLPRLDPTHIDLTDLDLAAAVHTMASATTTIADRAVALAKDATYVTVGFGMLGLQRAHAIRRRIEQTLPR